MLLTERLVLHASTLTASERALADDLQRHYPDGLLDSASAMASRAGTSASTVVRLFAKLGYASLAEVRREARSEVTVLLQTPAQRTRATIGSDRTLAECVDDALLHDQHNLTATRQGLDMAVFGAVVNAVSGCKGRVFVMAEKNSVPVSSYLTTHLNMCRPQVLELGAGAPFAVDRLLWTQPQDVLLVFTIRRYSNGALLAAQHFRQQGCTVIAITDSAAAPIVACAHHSLLVATANASPFDSYTAAFFLCNALVSAVAQQRHGEVAQTLQRRDALWKDFEADAVDGLRRTPQPAGRPRGGA
ncbi:MurR/RpiR family transcriptional regulator [Paracidovorax valerianellae]|uniref:Transcriptional regulator, RpiR family n=1 Tax=Paracidovorax valerianellae TaxID=187868 RepID=A0A1G6MI35_9BURK|nr:MurR/RpiR family transcriptional regulator [Paracidovorax valerianellae]MDA8444024.1 MurR/RpiR family transcriptional regulator [Paracidovorax valerianellae]SDC54615.1 transcriptional regulator, RpiR family [Paracidovorax valerianellae]